MSWKSNNRRQLVSNFVWCLSTNSDSYQWIININKFFRSKSSSNITLTLLWFSVIVWCLHWSSVREKGHQDWSLENTSDLKIFFHGLFIHYSLYIHRSATFNLIAHKPILLYKQSMAWFWSWHIFFCILFRLSIFLIKLK